MAEKEWIEIGTVIGDTGPKGDTGDIEIGTIVKGHYDSYADFIAVHPSGSLGDAYIVNGSYYYWNENGWANAGSVKGDTGDTGAKGDTGDKGVKWDTGATGPQGEKGDTGASVTIKGSYSSYEELINNHPTGSEGDSYLVNGSLYVWNGSAWENVGNIKGEKGDKGDTGDKGVKGDTGAKGDTGVKGDTGDKGSTGDVVPKEKKVTLEQVPMLM